MAQVVGALYVAPTVVPGGNGAVGTVKLTAVAPSGGFVVSLASNSALASTPVSVTVPAGSNAATFPVTTVPTAVDTNATLMAQGGGTFKTAILKVMAPRIRGLSFNTLTVFGGTKVTGTVTLTGPAPSVGAVVALSSDTTYAKVPGSAKVLSGATTVAFTITTSKPVAKTTAAITAYRANTSVTKAFTIRSFGLDALAPWPKFHRDVRNSGYAEGIVGTSQWTVPMGGAVLTSPAVGVDGTIYVGTNTGYVVALKGSDGSLLWSYKTGGRVASSPVLSRDGRLFVGSADKHLYALNMANGALIWKYATGGPINSTPALGACGNVYVGSFDTYLYAINQATGLKAWTYKTGDAIASSPNISPEGVLYVGSNDRYLYAINTLTAGRKWSYRTGAAIQSSPALANGNVYVGSFDGKVYALDANLGILDWSRQTDWFVYSSPCVDPAGNVFVGSDDGNLYSFTGGTGGLRWTFWAGDCVGSSPTVDLAGRVYSISDGGTLYALATTTGNPLGSAITGLQGTIETSTLPNGYALFATSPGAFQRKALLPTTLADFDIIWGTRTGIDRLDSVTNSVSTLMTLPVEPAWCAASPDGTRIAFRTEDGSIYYVNRNGTGLHEVDPAEGIGLAVKWSPDSQRLLYNRVTASGARALHEHDTRTGLTRVIVTDPTSNWVFNLLDGDYLTDTKIFYVGPRTVGSSVVTDLHTLDLVTGVDTVLKSGLKSAGYCYANPLTGLVAFSSTDNGSGGTITASIVTFDVVTGIYKVIALYGYGGWAMSPDDHLIYHLFTIKDVNLRTGAIRELKTIDVDGFALLKR